MSTVKKRQHFVPQAAHLSRFCNAEGYLQVYDKDKLTSFSAKPKDVANKHRFYDFPFEEDREWQTIENKLEEFEGLQKVCIEYNIANIKSYVNDDSFYIEVLDLEQKNELAHIIGLQFLRTLEHRKFISDWFKSTKHTLRKEAEEIRDQITKQVLEMMPAEYRSIFDDFLAETKENSIDGTIQYANWLYSEGLPIVQGEDMFIRCKDVADILLKHIWIIGINTFGEDKSFYTSDHPVAKNSHLLGIASKGVEISFPLNSEIILILLERENFKQYETLNNKIMQLTTEQIKHYNTMQVVSSDRQVYCRNNNFTLAEKITRNSTFDLSSSKRRY